MKKTSAGQLAKQLGIPKSRGLEAVLKARTDVVVATLPFHIHD